MGITRKDMGLEGKKDSAKAVLPNPPEREFTVWGEPQTDPDSGAVSREGEYFLNKFPREKELPPQEQFSDKVKNMVLAPVRGELDNGNLANFLRQLNEQRGFDGQDKLGLVLLINDNAKDKEHGKDVLEENHATSRYVSLLSAKDAEGIAQLDIPQEYKDLANDIIDKDKIEIRQDFLHSEEDTPHFGLLRSHLFKDAKAFKSSSLADNEVIAHLSDIDATYTSRHFEILRDFYADPSHEANLSEQDFLPGTQEGTRDEDVSRDLLSYLDEFRAYRYVADVSQILKGRQVASGTPVISGRLSYFEGKKLDEGIHGLPDEDYNEDWAIGQRMRGEASEASQFGNVVGNVGEVYRGHRARIPGTDFGQEWPKTDAEEAFSIVKKIRRGELSIEGIKFTQADEVIDNLEKKVAQAKNRAGEQDGHSDNFRESDEYRELVRSELQQEQAKVRLRRMRLMGYVDSLAGGKEISDTEQQIADPYLEYFQDETDEMKKALAEGKTPEQVSVSYIHKYDSFFNPDTAIHNQIARVRALKKYAFAHDLKTFPDS